MSHDRIRQPWTEQEIAIFQQAHIYVGERLPWIQDELTRFARSHDLTAGAYKSVQEPTITLGFIKEAGVRPSNRLERIISTPLWYPDYQNHPLTLPVLEIDLDTLSAISVFMGNIVTSTGLRSRTRNEYVEPAHQIILSHILGPVYLRESRKIVGFQQANLSSLLPDTANE